MLHFSQFVVSLLLLLLATYLLSAIFNKIISSIFTQLTIVIKRPFFKYTIKNRLPFYITLIIPYIFLKEALPDLFYGYKSFVKISAKLVDIALIFLIIQILMSILRSFVNSLQEQPVFKDKPMTSYLQLVQIFLFTFGVVGMFSIITGKSATAIFTAMGAASAITMLMFKDSIIGAGKQRTNIGK